MRACTSFRRFNELLIAGAVALTAVPATGSALTAAGVMADVNARGASAVVEDLWRGPGWDQLMAHIRTGQSSWLHVAVSIRPGTDGGSGETLALALGDALDSNPRNVLSIAAPAIGTEEICSGPDIDDYRTKEMYVAALDRRMYKVAALTDDVLLAVRTSCLKSLAETKEYMLSPKGPYS
jgi:hypothetical protein